ncbi:hypothetical protein IW140_006401 [Coemansia sp. RSA 1813]|nr:hypothetical protein EV178_002444 [Coemansia sp. RSA 1646]KAJ1767016.1 hypothetical protein LPJ74_005598 [Coemansia sp. RSA 1843]KAJ2093642.1 hypothetical protein IW138_000036 [Coemansia sp. RSA 986]KAJ2214973.1 hypothetical protein EV179_002503 [Coemansia sp. RSA 487]KAJ2562510.1 hypothetical protein IW140_006401 [Coemansia sp. RSA 1813]
MDEETKERLMTPGPQVEAPQLTPNIRLAALTRREENKVIELRRKQAYRRCKDAMQLFSECSSKHTIGVVWRCSEVKGIMNECLRRANTVDDMDRARAIFIDKKMKTLDEKKDKPRTLIG